MYTFSTSPPSILSHGQNNSNFSKTLIKETKAILNTYFINKKTCVEQTKRITDVVIQYLFLEFVLCVEVGGTRIKAAILPSMTTMETLKSIHTIAIPSQPWLNPNLYSLFNQSIETALSPLNRQIHSMTSISITGPVFYNGIYIKGQTYNLPIFLKNSLEAEFQQPVMLENDVVSWTRGAIAYLGMQSQEISYPFLALTLGTGVGAAFCLDKQTICALEIDFIDCPYKRVKALRPNFPNSYETLGKPFFNNLFQGKQFSDDDMGPYLEVYNKRFKALVADICDSILELFFIPIATLIVGGGNSRFICANEKDEKRMILLNPQKLLKDGVSADVIQLLGCQAAFQSEEVAVTTYPSMTKMVEIYQSRQKG